MEPLNVGASTTEAAAQASAEMKPEAPSMRAAGRGLRRTIATLLLASGLLAVGAVTAVSAASPPPSAPSASAAPAAGGGSTNPAPHSGTHGDCPGM